jgi:predicted RNA-binding protein YlxR (DUF448 family)
MTKTTAASSTTASAATAPKKKRGPRPKHIPQRTCIVCRTTQPKRAFVRIVRTPTGEVVIDPTGKKSGRGASVCGTRACWTRALAGMVLDRALRIDVRPDDRAALSAYTATLPETDSSDGAEA